MFGGFGITELLVILAIVVMLFGTKKLRNMGSDLGTAIKGFRSAMTTDEDKQALENSAPPPVITDIEQETSETKVTEDK